MRVAGRELVQPFDAFWERFGPEIPVPVEYTEKGTPWFYTWAIRYCSLRGDLPPRDWARLEAAYEERSADVYELGRKLGAIMERVGWGTRQQALEAMISARDTLGLKVDDRVLVIEPVSGKVF